MGFTRMNMIASGYFFLFIPVIFVALRVWARRIRHAGLGWDDYAIFCGLALTIAACVCQIVAATIGELGQHQRNDAKGEPILEDAFIVYEKAKFALQMVTIAGLGCIKASVIHLYLRIFKAPALSAFQIIGRIVLGVTAAWTIAFFFGSLFQCLPVTAIVEAYYSSEKCIDITRFYNAGCITDIIVDFLILVLPIPMVLKLQLSFRQRLAILGIFLLGTLAAASSIARLVVYYHFDELMIVHPDDRTYYMSGIFIVTVVEMDLAIISACLPTLRPLFIARDKHMLSSGYQTGRSLRSSRSFQYKRTTETIDDLEIPVLSRRNSDGFHSRAV